MTLSNSDKWLADEFGISYDEMELFVIEAQRRAATGPQPAVVAGTIDVGLLLLNAAISAALSVGVSLVAGLFKPRAPGEPGRIRSRTDEGANSRQASNVAPVDGFAGLATSAALGDPIPTVYALRENLPALNGRPAGQYGGVRVNMQMIWSNIESRGTYHLGRFIFMLGDGEIASLDPLGFALGGKAISPYNLSSSVSNEVGSQVTIYFKGDGGRIVSADRVAGKLAANDLGNAENAGGADVFEVRSIGASLQPHSSITGQPSGSNAFGVYGVMPNGLAFRKNPLLRPTRQFFARPSGLSGDQVADPENDPQALAQVWRMIYHFTHFCGITSTSIGTAEGAFGDLSVNATFVYTISNNSDSYVRFRFFNDDGAEYLTDIATAVSNRQRQAFDALSIGGIYRCGSCLAVLESLSPAATRFVSDADNEPPGGGVTVSATFRVLEAGRVYRPTTQEIQGYFNNSDFVPPDATSSVNWNFANLDRGPQYRTATAVGQLLRCAVADFTVEGPTRVIEIGIRSSVGIRDSGFVDSRRLQTLKKINKRAGGESGGDTISSGDNFDVSTYVASTEPRPERRFTFFRVLYRLEGTSDFVPLTQCFGVSGVNEQVALNAITVELPASNNPQIRVMPLSGYEIAQGIATGDLCVLDGTKGLQGPINSGVAAVWYRGDAPLSTRPASLFTVDRLEPPGRVDLGVLYTEGNTLLGTYARLAEVSPYPEIQASCEDGPEHEVVYVNSITVPTTVPDYDRISIVGETIQSGPELTTVDQPSAYVTGGQRVRRLLNSDTEGPSHLLPDLLLDKLLNSKNGAGERVTEAMIDIASFRVAAQWCLDRRYFYDGVIPELINILDWASEIAPAFLLRFGESGGQYYLKPAIQFNAVSIKALFTSGNVEQDTFKLNFLEPEDRQRIRVSVRFREERATSNLASPGLFAVTREVLVAEADGSGIEPIETLDLSAYCTNSYHAIDAAKLLIRFRRYSTHVIEQETTYDYETGTVAPDEYFQESMEETFYNGYTNGIVAPDGRLISKLPIENGSYSVLAWEPSSATPPAPATLNVTNGGETATPVNRLFTRIDPAAQVRTYRTTEIRPAKDGRFLIAAQETPTNSAGLLLASLNWDDPNAWIIDGADAAAPPLLPAISLSVGPASVLEDGATNLVYTFTRTGDTANSLLVNYAIGGTATNGVDYATIGTSVTFAVGSSIATVTVDPTPDSVLEPDETVSLALLASTTYLIGTPGAVIGTIVDDDAAAAFSINDISVLEGASSSALAVFTVTLNNAVAGGAAVSFATADGTALAGSDYIATSGTLNFAGNAGETQQITVSVLGDTVVEPDEFFFVNLFAPTNGATLADSQGVCTILNNSAPLVTLAVSPASVLEGSSTSLVYTFTRDGDTTNALVINYSISGTATNGVDYTTIGTSVTIAAGSATATVNVNPIDDSLIESDETVSLTLVASLTYLIGTSGAVTGTILNDDFGQAPDIVPVVGGVTISVDQGTTIIGTIPLISEFVLVSIQVNKAGWLRLYNSNAALAADAGRLRQNEPARDSGVMADPVFLGAETINYEPVVVCMNREAPLVNAYPFRLTNDGPSGTYTFTVTYLPISVYV